MSDSKTEQAIDLEKLAKVRGTTRWILHRLATRARIPSVTVDGQIRVKPSDYDAYLKQR
jgi:predicted transcriptional regulator